MNKKDLINEYVISTLEYNKLLKKGADYKETNKIALKLEKLDERFIDIKISQKYILTY